MQTSSGIFSPDGIDKGTAVLLAEAPAPAPQGTLLDIGCGWGPISITLALRSPGAHVWGVDINRRSLDLARSNAALADRIEPIYQHSNFARKLVGAFDLGLRPSQ